MKKQTKVLLAAAALTLGASFTAMAATYDWKVEDGQWVCYDEDGDAYEDEWVESAGKDYYVGEDGVLQASQWVDTYYIDSTGAKTTNAWKYVLPEGVDEDDEDAEAKWFYFGSKGLKTTGKKVIDGVTYYFNKDGEMLTGWVDYVGKVATEATKMTANTVYVGEDGARLANTWLEEYAPEVDPEEDEDAEKNWFYIKADGEAKVGRALDINGETYFFANDGKMLSGWVGVTGSNADEYENIKTALGNYDVAYYCGDEDEGWAKKSAWINDYRSSVASADDDIDSKYWFWADAKGKILKASTATTSNATTSNAAEELTLVNGETYEVETRDGNTTTHATTKEINGKDYIFNQNGEMLSGLVDYKNDRFYYSDAEDGSMQVGEVVIEDTAEEESYNFYFAKTKKDGYDVVGSAVTGAAAGKLYNNGLLATQDDDTYDYDEVFVGGKYYVIDEDGNIKTSNKEYKEKQDDGSYKIYLDTLKTEFGKTGNTKGSYTTSAVVNKISK